MPGIMSNYRLRWLLVGYGAMMLHLLAWTVALQFGSNADTYWWAAMCGTGSLMLLGWGWLMGRVVTASREPWSPDPKALYDSL